MSYVHHLKSHIHEKCFRYQLTIPTGYDQDNIPTLKSYMVSPERLHGSVWFHIVFNFLGLNDDQGIAVYHSGLLSGNPGLTNRYHALMHTGPMALGVAYFLNGEEMFSSLQVDELLFFNSSLTAHEISILSPSPT